MGRALLLVTPGEKRFLQKHGAVMKYMQCIFLHKKASESIKNQLMKLEEQLVHTF